MAQLENDNQIVMELLNVLGISSPENILEVAVVVRPNELVVAHVAVAISKENFKDFVEKLKGARDVQVKVRGIEPPVMQVNTTLKPNKDV